MGLTCANIHVFAGGQHAGLQQAGVSRVIDDACDRLGYERVESDYSAESDLVAVTAQSWLSVLQPRSPGIITEAVAKLAGQLSEVSGCPVLAASVYDSDEFAFLVFEGGRQVDGFATQDDLLPAPFEKWTANRRAQEWSRLFGRSLDSRDVRELTQPPGLFAEDRLAALCRLVGIPIEHGVFNPSDLDQPTALGPRCYRLQSAAVTVDSDASVMVDGDASVTQFVPPSLETQYRTGGVPKPLPLMPGEETGYYVLLNGPAGAFSDPVLELFGPAVERGLVEVFYGHGEWYCGDENIIPRKKQRLAVEEIGAGKRWQKLFAKAGAIQSLFLQIVVEERETALPGASVQRTFEDDDVDVAGTIHLAFWRRCLPARASDEAERDARGRLTSLIDSAFETMGGLQGWIARWDWIPRFSMGEENNYTPYEGAYAIDSPAAERDDDSGGYMDEKWCSRCLRGLGERLWLGAPLWERIDRERLAAIATVTDVGSSSARFDLSPDVELHRLEELLVPILPISRISLED